MAFNPWPLARAARRRLAPWRRFGRWRQAPSRGGERPLPRRARRLVVFVGAACVTGTATSVAYYTRAGQPSQSVELGAGAPRERASRKAAVRFADPTDAWLQSLLNPSFWERMRGETGRSRREPTDRPYRLRPSPKPQTVRGEGVSRLDDGATYRTMCVRLCDGYYWPVSYTARRREFARDAAICERSCDQATALHVYRNPGEEPDDMVDLKGQPYAKLSAAFRYRVSYDEACKCRPHPWEDASRQRHLSYPRSDQAQAVTTRKR
ncbi:MAG: DUF2865 domain-containing protein [Hyphomonadaceae bacterium]|nr:DUF2865 domain-containing protein [Hyphomonadaceae bacterium]